MPSLLYHLSFNVLIFSLFFTTWRIREESNEELYEWLEEHDMEFIHPFLNSVGVWSCSQLAATSMFILPSQLLNQKEFVASYRKLKDETQSMVMLPLWLRDKGLYTFMKLNELENLQTLGYRYPGEIYNTINMARDLDQAERYELREDVHRFKQAIREFVSGVNSVAVIAHRKSYENELLSWRHHFSPDRIHKFFQDHPKQLLYMLAFVLVCHLAVMQGIPAKLPGSSSLLPTLILFWCHPPTGCFAIYTLLLNRVMIDPARSCAYTVLLTLWMLFSNEQSGTMFLLSIIPTLAFFLCLNALKFQPMVVKRKDSTEFDVAITGIGSIDSQLRTFVQRQWINPLYKIMLALNIHQPFFPEEMRRIKLEDVDISWSSLKVLLEPSLTSGKLQSFIMMNNNSFTNADANEFADLIHKNKSLEYLKIAYDYEQSLTERLYQLMFWDAVHIKFTCRGAQVILDAVKENKESSLKTVDFYGIDLDTNFLESARELKKTRESISIMGSKPGTIATNWSSSLCQFILVKIVCLIAATAFCVYQMVQIMQKGEIDYLTWWNNAQWILESKVKS